jgi:hypothetical protein
MPPNRKTEQLFRWRLETIFGGVIRFFVRSGKKFQPFSFGEQRLGVVPQGSGTIAYRSHAIEYLLACDSPFAPGITAIVKMLEQRQKPIESIGEQSLR